MAVGWGSATQTLALRPARVLVTCYSAVSFSKALTSNKSLKEQTDQAQGSSAGRTQSFRCARLEQYGQEACCLCHSSKEVGSEQPSQHGAGLQIALMFFKAPSVT